MYDPMSQTSLLFCFFFFAVARTIAFAGSHPLKCTRTRSRISSTGRHWGNIKQVVALLFDKIRDKEEGLKVAAWLDDIQQVIPWSDSRWSQNREQLWYFCWLRFQIGCPTPPVCRAGHRFTILRVDQGCLSSRTCVLEHVVAQLLPDLILKGGS
ncbi:hypothetical protein BC828DRAFT_387057 [Blastocladiella britannica]|nr:hypothetical protein BC828DRAFT_387057 [Blastocladiella britannica]